MNVQTRLMSSVAGCMAAGVFCLAAPTSQAATIDFDVAADLADFSESGATSGTQFVHSTAVGVDGAAGRVDTSMPGGGDNESITYDGTAFDFSADSPITISTSFLFGGNAITNTRFGIGLTDDTGANNASYYDLNTTHVHVRLQASDSDTFFFRSQQFFGDGSNSENGPDGDSVDLVLGEWYTLTATFTPFTNPGDDTFSFDASITRVSNGTELGSLTGSFANANVDLANDSTVYGGVRIDAPADIDAFDNLTVIPEPASLAMLGLGGIMLLRRRR